MIEEPTLPWLSLLALGAAHGINPAMGWLFAVGRGLQARDRRALWRALGPLALGHALAIAAAVTVAVTVGHVVSLSWTRWLVAAALLGVGIDSLLSHRHVRLGGMGVSARELTVWSFLMASAHGAGLMVLPFVLGSAASRSTAALHDHHAMALGGGHSSVLAAGAAAAPPIGIAVPLIHTLGYLVVTAVLAAVVYEKLGVRILRRAWINVNVVWAAALMVAGLVTALS